MTIEEVTMEQGDHTMDLQLTELHITEQIVNTRRPQDQILHGAKIDRLSNNVWQVERHVLGLAMVDQVADHEEEGLVNNSIY